VIVRIEIRSEDGTLLDVQEGSPQDKMSVSFKPPIVSKASGWVLDGFQYIPKRRKLDADIRRSNESTG
jgi:hypothetical protein